MTYEEICDAVVKAKGIDYGFITYKYELYKDPKSTRNQGGGFNSSHEIRKTYRAVLYGDRTFDTDATSPTCGQAKGPMIETEGPDLLNVVRAAFEGMKLPLPAGIGPAKKK